MKGFSADKYYSFWEEFPKRFAINGHRSIWHISLLFIILGFTLFSTGCLSPQLSGEEIQVSVNVNEERVQIQLPAGSTVEDALTEAEIAYTETDQIEPPLYTLLVEDDEIYVVQVREEFEREEKIIPYEKQIVRNESLPEGEKRLIQLGENGLEEIVYRSVYEDGVEVSNRLVKKVTLREAVPQITMVGAQTVFAPIPIPGIIAYLSGGNAWIMEDSTANRRPLVTTGDLDGRIFALSPNAGWLLFTRKSDKDPTEEINTLWAVSTQGKPKEPLNLHAANVVHFAGWRPNHGARVYYSTVEPRNAAPGWQANNDLYSVSFSASFSPQTKEIIEPSSGGVYGWWGMDFMWSPDGRTLAYTRPDEIGIVDRANGEYNSLLDITALSTHSNWAWIPGITWGADNKMLYAVTHAPSQNLVGTEESPYFDLSAVVLSDSEEIKLSPQTGMFAYPAASMLRPSGQEHVYQIAYLQAIFPSQSESSRYRIVVMDRDGSNRHEVFPPKDTRGIEPQIPVWAPEPIPGQEGDFLAVTYQGNLWLIDSASAETHQITGDGLISRIDWKSLEQ